MCEGFGSMHFCGGTILDANTVLSAGHCFANRHTGEPESSDGIVVVAGALDFAKIETVQVSNIAG